MDALQFAFANGETVSKKIQKNYNVDVILIESSNIGLAKFLVTRRVIFATLFLKIHSHF